MRFILLLSTVVALLTCVPMVRADTEIEFFEKRIRPILVKRCYECHSEEAKEREGGLLLDRRSGWMAGGDSGKAVTPGDPDESLIIKAVRFIDDNLQMPPEDKLPDDEIRLLEQWITRGAHGPAEDLGETEFSQLGNQDVLFALAKDHWAFQPVKAVDPPNISDDVWSRHPIDRFVYAKLEANKLKPSRGANPRSLMRRLSFDLTGLPPTPAAMEAFLSAAEKNRNAAIVALVDELLASPAFGEHFARRWLDIARYADTDGAYRADTKTPHYYPFAFTYRDYVIESFNTDKPIDQFIREQLAADLMDLPSEAPELAATGFLTVGPHANRNQVETVDDWIDTTTRGLIGMTVACARCHDHKYEPIPTADYYALHGVFSSVQRIHPLDDKRQPLVNGYQASKEDLADYAKKRAAIDKKIDGVGNSKTKNNNRSVAEKIRETELAELLLFHPGAPVHTMVVKERPRPVEPVIQIRGDPRQRGEAVKRRFLSILDASQKPFTKENSGRLQLAQRITDSSNPLTSRVFVNRIWGALLDSHLVQTPSDFGLQGAKPTHPQLLDWLAADFMEHEWSLKHLVRQIVLSKTYQQTSRGGEDSLKTDPENEFLGRANRKHLSIEALRDSMLAVSGELDRTSRGRASKLWGDDYSKRRTIYGYINRFNLDPTLRAFDFPSPMQTHPTRGESVVAPQALFTMNSPFVFDQATAVTESDSFQKAATDEERIQLLFAAIYQRPAAKPEVSRLQAFLVHQEKFKAAKRVGSSWALAAQAMLMSNEFQYVD